LPIASKEEVRLLKSDIAYIKISPARFARKDDALYKNKIFLLMNTLPLIILAAIYLFELYRNRLKTDIGYARSLRARGAASKRLKVARNLANKNMVKEFYTEIYKAVIEYIADKLNIPHPSITKDSLEERLTGIGLAGDIIGEVKMLFDDCDMVRFASAKFTKDDMGRTLKQAADIITGLERYI